MARLGMKRSNRPPVVGFFGALEMPLDSPVEAPDLCQDLDLSEFGVFRRIVLDLGEQVQANVPGNARSVAANSASNLRLRDLTQDECALELSTARVLTDLA